eukprot:Opistho-2@62701
MRAAFALVLVALACVGTANAFQIVVDAHAEECFFDVIKKGTKMALAFQVSDGGFLDIDVKVGACNTLHQPAIRINCVCWECEVMWVVKCTCTANASELSIRRVPDFQQ